MVALPCPLDFVLINTSSHRFGSSHDDKDLSDVVTRLWFSLQFSFKIQFKDFHLLSVL